MPAVRRWRLESTSLSEAATSTLRWLLLTSLLVLAITGRTAEPRILVVVNKGNLQAVDAGYVRRIYTEAKRSWPDGSPVLALDQEQGGTEHEAFCQEWLGRSAASMQAIWSQNIFSGKGLPPRVVTTDAGVKSFVAAHLNAIGYIRSDSVDETVKVIRP